MYVYIYIYIRKPSGRGDGVCFEGAYWATVYSNIRYNT